MLRLISYNASEGQSYTSHFLLPKEAKGGQIKLNLNLLKILN